MPDDKKDLSEFELGTILSRIDAGQQHLLKSLHDFMSETRKAKEDHEMRLRTIEKDMAFKRDTNKVHERVDGLESKLTRVLLWIAGVTGSGVVGVGGYSWVFGG